MKCKRFTEEQIIGVLKNIFIERLWRSVKYEDIDLKAYDSIPALRAGLTRYFEFYDQVRRH